MVNWFCGFLWGSAATLLLYSLLVGKKIQEEQDKATKCIFKYEEYRRKIRTLEYRNNILSKRIESIKNEVK